MDNLRNYFFDPMEKEIAVLGEDYLLHFIKTGYPQKTYCLLTNQRLYISGKRYSEESGFHIAEKDNLSLRLDVIHSLEFVKKPFFFYRLLIFITLCVSLLFLPGLIYTLYAVSKHYMSLGILQLMKSIGLIVVLPAIAFLLNRYHRRDLFLIRYEEGGAAIPAEYYEKKQIQKFIENIRLAKDELSFKERKTSEETRDYNRVADELTKYKDMLDNHLIDEAEYQILKNRLIRMPTRF